MRLVILGGPGAGKGTQAQQLGSYFQIPVIATGEFLRQTIASQTSLGLQAQLFVEKGELVPDPTMIEFMRERLSQPDVQEGWLLDGYPRTAFQAEELDFLLDDWNQRLDWAIWLEVSEEVLIQRSIARSRQDDQLEIVKRRIELFQQRTLPILEYYERRQRLLTINGNQSSVQVQEEILSRLSANP